MIVYRGTSSAIDFHANFHWLTKWIDLAHDQYEQVHLVLKKIEEHLPENYELYSAGHSLGGGLAQHTVYNSVKVNRAYVFNSTPVTGWKDIDTGDRSINAKGATIYRVHEKGEVLEFLRLLMKAGYLLSPEPNRDPYVKEYRMDLKAGNIITEHDILSMAQSLEEAHVCSTDS